MASTTNRISSGSTASLMPTACRIISSSMPSRPAVSMMTTLCRRCRASSSDWRATSTGSPTPLPGEGANTGTDGLLAEHLELLHGVRPLQVSGDQQRGVALLPQPERELRREGGLARALQAGQHDHGRRHLGKAQPPRLAAEDRDQLLINDLDDLLGGIQRRGDLFARRPLLDLGDEGPDHRQRDVRLQQRDPDLTAGGVDVGGGQPPAPAQRGEDLGQPIGESLEHVLPPSSRLGYGRLQAIWSAGRARHRRCSAQVIVLSSVIVILARHP